jgi:hypothetical protein
MKFFEAFDRRQNLSSAPIERKRSTPKGKKRKKKNVAFSSSI